MGSAQARLDSHEQAGPRGQSPSYEPIFRLEELLHRSFKDAQWCESIKGGRIMSQTYKPHGDTSVAPHLIVDGVAKTIEFLVNVFGAERLRVVPGAGGKIMHGEVRIDDTVGMLSDGADGWPPVPSNVHVYVSDVDAVYERALAAGAVSLQPPTKKDDEDKRGGVRDAGGTTWWIGTKVE